MARFEDYVNEDTLNALRKQKQEEDEAKLAMPEKSMLDRLKEAGNVLTSPSEYDELDTSGYLPNQQLAGQGLLKTAGVLGALTEQEPRYWKNPITGEVEQQVQFDPSAIGGMKIARSASQLSKASKLGTLGEAISSKTKEGMQSIANKAGAKKLAEEIRSGARSLGAEEIKAINEDPELLSEFTKQMSTPKQDFTLVGGPRNVPGTDFRMVGEGKLTPFNPAETTQLSAIEKKAAQESSSLPTTPRERSLSRTAPEIDEAISKNSSSMEEPIEASFKQLPVSSQMERLSASDKLKRLFLGLGAGATAYNLLSDNEKEDQKSGSGQLPPEQKLTSSISPEKTSTDNVPTATISGSDITSPSDASNVPQDLQKSQESLLDAFKKAQEEDKQSQAMAMLQMGASDMLRGGLGASYKVALPEASNKVWEDQLKSRDAMKAFLANQEMQKEDPNSPISKRMREITKPMLSKLGITMPEGMSYSEIENNFPQFTKMFNIQAATEERKEAREQRDYEKSEKQTEGQKQLDKDFAKHYNEWESSGRSTYNKNLKRLEDSKKSLENASLVSGRIVGSLPKILRTEEGKRIQQDVQAAAQGSLKATLGAQFTEKEGERIMNMAYDPSLSAEENIRKIDMAIDEIKSNAQSNEQRGKHFEQYGTLKGYSSSPVEEKNTDIIVDKKTGKKYLVDHDTKKVIKEIQ